jgi:hypothetical protein
MDAQPAKYALEKLHTKYLVENLNLQVEEKYDWDLCSEKHNFELKTRLYYLDRSHAPPDNIWFFISENQRLDYEEMTDKEMYWIFLASKPAKELKDIDELTEDYILHRNIFFTPWDIYKHFKVGTAIENSKLGPGRTLGQRRIQKLIDFDKYKLDKANIFFPQKEDLEYLLK